MMAHLIKLFNCSGNHYHHHRCSIIHHFWRALLTSGAHSPALLKRGQISPTPLGVSAGYDLSPVESCPKAYSEAEMKREKEKKKKAYPPSRLLPLILSPHNSLLSLSLSPSQTHTEYFILLERPPPNLPGSRVKATRRGFATFYSPEWVQSWRRRRLLRNNLFSILWAGDHEPGREPGVGERARSERRPRLLGCREPGGGGGCRAERAGRP